MSTDDNDAYGDLDKSNLKFIYCQFLATEKEVLQEGISPSCKTSGCSSQFLVSLDDDLMLHYYT